MKRIILLYGVSLSLLILLLKWIDYRFWVHDISMEIYMGAIAAIFTGLGIWMGLKLTNPKVIVKKEKIDTFEINENNLKSSNISQREYEILKLLAQGHSNQEIADQLFISLSTVKSHVSNLYSKLDVKRRTQAIQQAKKLSLLP